jgi:hypothetical protein
MNLTAFLMVAGMDGSSGSPPDSLLSRLAKAALRLMESVWPPTDDPTDGLDADDPTDDRADGLDIGCPNVTS